MVADNFLTTNALLNEFISEGSITIDEVNDRVRRILEVKLHLGLFDEPVITDFANYSFFSAAN